MSAKDILLLGDERLYDVSLKVENNQREDARRIILDLADTMKAFQKKYGFGRAIAAPQIGEAKRIIYLNNGDLDIGFINPELEFISNEQFKIWDDCMSFPGLEVKLWRYKKVKVYYKDVNWNDCKIEFEGDLAELLQHEYDHLDGILANQRAIDKTSLRINKERAMCY